MKSVTALIASVAAAAFLYAFPGGNAQAQTVLITGSNQGIGLEFARQYGARGYTVYATHRRDSTPDTLAELSEQYPNVIPARMDVTREDEIRALAERLDGEPVDIVINNASLIRFAHFTDREGNAGQYFGTLDYDHFDMFMRTNVAGPLMIAEAFADHLRRSEYRQLINISSRAGMITEAGSPDHYWYRISKTALNQGMRLTAEALRDDGITVVMFHPGGVQVESWGDLEVPGALTPEEAIGRMISVIDSLTIEDTGRFLQNDGSDHPW